MTKLFVFSPLSAEEPKYNDAYKGLITNIVSYSITKKATSVGEFSIVLPVPVSIVKNIECDDILWLQDGDKEYWLIVRKMNYSTSNNTLTLAGTDLKGLLSKRITLYPPEEQDKGTFGYDVKQGTTEECCNHYVNNNAVDANDSNRNIFGLVFTESGSVIGVKEDTYMSRFENLADVIEKLTDNAKIVWDIVGKIYEDRTLNDNYVFSVSACVDKSKNQSVRPQAIISPKRKNVKELQREISNTELKNVLYATKSGGTLESDAFTATVYRDTEIPNGIKRNEIQLNVSCEEFSDIEQYALHDATDYVSTDSITFEVAHPEDYGKKYDVGDIVTVVDSFGNAELTDAITAVTINSSKTDYKVQITVGFSEPKPVKKIINKINKGVI